MKNTKYVLLEPLVTVYDDIEELARAADEAETPFSEAQQVKLGLKIIRNTNDFEDGLRKWYDHPNAEHTWDNFKTHFEEARELLKKLRGEDFHSHMFHQANAIAEVLRHDMENQQETLRNDMEN